VGDLIPLIHALKVTPGYKREKPLWFFGPPGFVGFFENQVEPIAPRPKHFEVLVEEVRAEFEFLGLRVLTTPTVHSEQINSVAYRFEDGRDALVLSGDCDYDPGIIELAKGAGVLVLDCSFPDALKMGGHLSAGECGRVAALACVKRLVLSHLYPVPKGQDSRLRETQTAFRGEVCLAQDLMRIQLNRT
jgi:ribonuclease BN (tRNA processing enzyme)